LVKDQIGKARLSLTDVMGRVTNVWEITAADDSTESISFPGRPEITSGYRTKYFYDALSNLMTVVQQKGQFGPSQSRYFFYDSLSRLRSTRFPESGFVSYIYDDNDNLTTRIDARGVITTYVYDELNRPTSRSYNDGTAAVTYSYDSATVPNGKGRLASISSSASDYSYSSYDALGRVLSGSQLIRGQINRTYSMSYTYDLAGNMKSMTYPSGRVVANSYDAAGRLTDFTGNLGDGTLRNYSTGINYSTFGGMSQEQFGTATPVFNKWIYTSRGQVAEIRAGLTPFNLTWERGGIINYYSNNCSGSCGGSTSTASMTDNNGNLKKQEHWIPNASGVVTAVLTQKSDYDDLNRLQRVYDGSSSSPTWQQRFVYDRFGNRTIEPANPTPGINNTQFDRNDALSTNRLYAPGDTALPMPQRRMQYDAAGNLTFDNYTGQGGRSYDAENRMTLAFGNGSSQFYSYDGEGHRVKRTVNGVETWQVYSVNGDLLAEYAAGGTAPQKEFGYRNGQLLITTALTSGANWGPPPAFTDNPLNPNFTGETIVKALHISQLRAAINSVRSHKNLAPVTWQSSANAGDFITINPVSEMRTALDQAIGLPNGGYSTGLAAGQRIKAIHVQELRDRILSSWNTSGTTLELRWIIADQLGTPRMILDQSGSLANTSRHDYLPFGEELFAGTFGRTTALGYTNADGVRQKFTGKERDVETGLDYFGARYYAKVQGRFTAPDPLLSSATVGDPQSWNRYSYTVNNPLRYIDPDGLWWWDASAGGSLSDADLDAISKNTSQGRFRSWATRRQAKNQLEFRKRFRGALSEAKNAASSNLLTPDEQQQIKDSVAAYGSENSGDVTVGVRPDSNRSVASTTPMPDDSLTVFFNHSLRGDKLTEVATHEGRHVADFKAWVNGGECRGCSLDMDHRQTETRAWTVSSYMGQALDMRTVRPLHGGRATQVWNRGWKQVDISTKRASGLNEILKLDPKTANPTPASRYSGEHKHHP
jgi:RHS repeat-associated protein